jgi:hypothetical protein
MNLVATNPDGFDASQFKLQADGTFRITLRGMASMAGVAVSGLSASLASAVHENPLPCARSLLAQRFNPVHVSTWGDTGGIPEDAAPFILEHYAFNAASPSELARKVLLSFSRVGINAYVKERLGIGSAQPVRALAVDVLSTVERSIELLERLGGLDARSELMLKDLVLNHAASAAGGGMSQLPQIRMISLNRAFIDLAGATPGEATKLAKDSGRAFKHLYFQEHGRWPNTHKQLVNGADRDVCDYELAWIESHTAKLRQLLAKHRGSHGKKLR